MKQFFNHFKRLDWPLIAAATLLTTIGLVSIYSSSLGRGDFFNFKKQIFFFAIGIALMFLFSFFDWRILKDNSFLILALYVVSVVSLIGLFYFAPEIRGVKSWYKAGPFAIDPIEFTKIILVILLAKYFSRRHIEMYRVSHIILSGFYVLLPAALIFKQPNFGSFLILISLWAGILIVSGIKLRHFLILFLLSIIFVMFSWFFLLGDYQKERVISFVQPTLEPLGIGWSQRQSQIAIGAGGIFGQGFGKGSQTQYGFLPESQTDFIFAAIGEEFGLLGIGSLLLIFCFLIFRLLKVALDSQLNFLRLFILGFIFLLVSQVVVHIGMNLGLFPIIGLPLSFVSYGGSGLIAAYIMLGITQAMGKKNS